MYTHEQLEKQFLDLVAGAGIPAPDDTARLERALIFLWYDTKAFVLIDLAEMPPEDPFRGMDIELLREDVLGSTGFPDLFAEAG
jgi:hypothetical protein